jgi:hypothetical protein
VAVAGSTTAASTVDQIAFVVPDIEASMRFWAGVMGVGPFFYLRRSASRNMYYEGERIAIVSSTALAQAGGVQVELIQVRNDVPNAYTGIQPRGPGSLHHVGRFVEDYPRTKQDMIGQGMELVQEGDASDTIRFCYFRQPGSDEPLLELIEIPMLRDFFATIRDAAATWDGVEAFREVTPSL